MFTLVELFYWQKSRREKIRNYRYWIRYLWWKPKIFWCDCGALKMLKLLFMIPWKLSVSLKEKSRKVTDWNVKPNNLLWINQEKSWGGISQTQTHYDGRIIFSAWKYEYRYLPISSGKARVKSYCIESHWLVVGRRRDIKSVQSRSASTPGEGHRKHSAHVTWWDLYEDVKLQLRKL